MFSHNGKISEHQAVRLLIMDMFTSTCLFLPMALPRVAGNGSVPGYILGIFLTWLYGEMLVKNYSYSSSGEFFLKQYSFGKVLCRIVCGIRCFATYIFMFGLFTSVLQETFLYNMTKIIITGAMIGVLLYGSRKGPEVRARLAELFFYIVLLPIFLIGFFSIAEAEWGRIIHISGSSWSGIIKAGLVTWVLMMPVEWLIYMPLEYTEKTVKRIFRKSMLIGSILPGIIFILCVAVLGIPEMAGERWPTVILMQIMKIPGGFVSRQDGLMLSFWIFAMFISLSGASNHTSYFFYGNKRKIKYLVIYAFILIGGGISMITEMSSIFLHVYFYFMIFTGILLALVFFGRWFFERNRKSYKKILGILMIFLLGLSGCENYVELENRDFVMAMGVDTGVVKKYQFTFVFPDLSATTGTGSETKPDPVVLEADSLKEAEADYNRMSDKQMDFGQLKAIVFGDTFLLRKKRLDLLVDEIKRTPEISRTVNVCRCSSLARELVCLDKKMDTSIGIYLEELFKNQQAEIIFNEWMGQRKQKFLPEVKIIRERVVLLDP